jgi:hypothetical protein
MPILEEMKTSHENNEPLKIKGSAYSKINKEELKPITDKSRPKLG